MYELVWTRHLYLFFGSTIHSITTVVAAYMGGLGLGAFVLGRLADRRPTPARLYGMLELGIGAFGLVSAWVLDGVGTGYLAVARLLGPGPWLAAVVKFGFAFTVLLVPTFLMGGTLPALTRAFAGGRLEGYRRQLALFYGVNTLGGVAGCLLAGFVLVERAGVRGTLLGVGLVNLGLGVAALLLARGTVPEEAPDAEGDDGPEHPVEPAGAATGRLALWLIGATAFASLLYEIGWTRVLVLVLGSSTYAFTTILGAFLAGIGFGSLLAVGPRRRPRDLLLAAAIVQAVVAVFASLLFPFFDALPVYVVATMQVRFLSATDLVALHALAAAAVVVPATLGMGVTFPLLAEVAARRGGATGAEAGRAYFANTVGSILGSVLTGFALIHLLGSERTLEIGVAVNAGAATLLVWWVARRAGPAPRVAGPAALLLGVAAVAIVLVAPPWSRRTLDRAPMIYGRDRAGHQELDRYLRAVGSEQLSFEEGWNATISVWRNGTATWLKTNGKVDASSVGDMNTQVLVGLLPALAHPRPRRAFVVGFGSGVSVRTLADAPGVERVDVAEIEGAVLRASRFFRSVNRDVLDDPKVHVIEDDARSALQLARQPYDVIASEPSNPWIAGVASLYTADYFRIVRSRLRSDGVLAQWLQTYRVPPGLVAVVVRNLRTVFPYVEIWYANQADLVVLASPQPIRWRRERVAAVFDAPGPLATAMRDWLRMDRPESLLGYFLLGDSGSAVLARGARFVHSDDHPALEFVAARALLAGPQGMVFDSLVALKTAIGETRPAASEWPVTGDDLAAAYARALPPGSDRALELARRLAARAPTDPDRALLLGEVLLGRREYAPALAAFDRVLALRPGDVDALIGGGMAQDGLGDAGPARERLLRARAVGGGDSALVATLLADLAVRAGDDTVAAAEALRAVRGLRPTLRTPMPGDLEPVLRTLAGRAGPDVAGALFDVAVRSRPSWDLAFAGGAEVYARGGRAGCRRAEALAAELPRFGWDASEVEAVLRPCRGATSP